jgi:hypothetical protein
MIPTTSTSRLRRSWYVGSIAGFQSASDDQVLAELVRSSSFSVLQSQRDAWLAEFSLLRKALGGYAGTVYLEFEIPRMGHRVDAIVLVSGIVLAIEFKIDAKEYSLAARGKSCRPSFFS